MSAVRTLGETWLGAVRVELADLAGTAARATQTDPFGRFRFEGVAPGEYRLTAGRPGGPRAERFVTVAGSGPYETELRLATPVETALLSVLWVALALLLVSAFCSSVVLFGVSRRRRDGSAPRSVTVALLLWAAAFLLFRVLAPEMQPVHIDVAEPLSAIVSALLATTCLIVVLELQPTAPAAAGALIAGLLLAITCRSAGLPATAQWLGIGIGLLLWTSAAGWLLSLWLRRRSYLVLAALSIAVVDIYAVFFGSTGALVQSDAAAARAVVDISTLPWPVIGSDLVFGSVGAGDYLFMALFLAAALRYEFGLSRNYWALLAALTVGKILAHTLAVAGLTTVGLPALPFLSAFFLATNQGKFEVGPTDRRQIAGFVTLLVLVLGVSAGLKQRRQAAERVDIEVGGGPAPAPVARLWAPGVVPASVEVSGHERVSGCVVEDLVITVQAGGRRLPGFLAYPLGPAPAVAVVAVPEWGVRPKRDTAISWARRGVAWLSFDWCTAKPRSPTDFEVALSGAIFSAMPEPSRSPLYVAAAAAAAATAHVAGRPELGRVTLLGDGLGALAALAAAGPARPKALVLTDVGRLDAGAGRVAAALGRQSGPARDAWLRLYDPAQNAAALRCPVLFLAGTNDPAFDLAAVSGLYETVDPARARWILGPNLAGAGTIGLEKPLERWLRAALAGAGGAAAMRLSVARQGSLLRFSVPASDALSAATFHVAAVPPSGAWPGAYWVPLPGRRTGGALSALAEVWEPATSLAVYAEAQLRDGTQACSPLTHFSPAQLGISPPSRPWAMPQLAGFADGPEGWRPATGERREGWRVVAEDGLLRVLPPQGLVGTATFGLETNNVTALRRLGGVAERLELSFAGEAPVAVIVELTERLGLPGERSTRAPAQGGGRDWSVAMRAFGPPGTIVWEEVDRLVLQVTATAPDLPALDAIGLAGTAAGIRAAAP